MATLEKKKEQTTTTTTTAAPTANGGTNPKLPASKGQLYNTRLPTYRPRPPPPRRRRSCCCSCFLWTSLIILTIIILVSIATAVFWVLYRPVKPNFAVSTLHFSQFNLTTTAVISQFNLTMTARNPNEKITFFYNPISISISSEDINIGDGNFQGFVHGTKNTTVLKTIVSSSGQQPMDGSDVATLRSHLKKKKSLTIKIQLNTKVKLKFGSLKTMRLSIRVTCGGVQVALPTGKTPSTAASGVKCKVEPRFRILNWTF